MELVNFLEKAYAEVSDNVKFSEAKNAALITLNSALISWGGSIVFESNIRFVYKIIIALFVFMLFIPLICSVVSFKATISSENWIVKKLYSHLDNYNSISEKPEKLLYYAYIHKYYNNNPQKYVNDVYMTEVSGIEETIVTQLATQIIDLASIAYKKFTLFNIGLKMECFIFLLGFFSLLVTLFFDFIIKII